MSVRERDVRISRGRNVLVEYVETPRNSPFPHAILDFLLIFSRHISLPLSLRLVGVWCSGRSGDGGMDWECSVGWWDTVHAQKQYPILPPPRFFSSISLPPSLLFIFNSLNLVIRLITCVSLSLPLLVLTAYLFYLTVSRLTWRPPSTDA